MECKNPRFNKKYEPIEVEEVEDESDILEIDEDVQLIPKKRKIVDNDMVDKKRTKN